MNEYLILMKSELLLTAIIFVILFFKIRNTEPGAGVEAANDTPLLWINVLLLLNFIAGFFLNNTGFLFGEMFTTNAVIAFEKNLLNLATLIVSMLSYDWLRTHRHVYEFYMLLLSTLLGMFFMISTQNLLMFYLSLELATIPLAALVNFDLHRKRSSEAAMKMIMMSAFSSGILLFGISMFYGTTGTLSLTALPLLIDHGVLQLFSLILLLAGFCFKISAVPFHLWTADVYEGAPVPVTAYLSVVSKASILFVMVPVLYKTFQPFEVESYQLLFLLSIATMIVGNLFAMRQNNLKRLLAFSSIAQVGFILVGITGQSVEGATSVVYFILIYIFSNLGAFGVIALVSALADKETIYEYRGFYKTNPLLSWVLAISLFSLAGIPPVAGFFGKFFLLMAGAAKENYELVIIASLNMIASLYYYLKVIKSIFMENNDDPIPTLKINMMPKAALIICMVGMLVTGIYGEVYNYIYSLISVL